MSDACARHRENGQKNLIDKSILVRDALVCRWMRLIGSGPEILRRPPEAQRPSHHTCNLIQTATYSITAHLTSLNGIYEGKART